MGMISMKAVLDIISQYCPDDDGSCSKADVDLREMLDEIEGLEETEVAPVKHGRWILHTKQFVDVKIKLPTECSECGFEEFSAEEYNFCPKCGAKMF